ncbi:MAG: serine/threonine-protein kinase [bacterium]|nr:serine/threonine-protein kinase [bacterium]
MLEAVSANLCRTPSFDHYKVLPPILEKNRSEYGLPMDETLQLKKCGRGSQGDIYKVDKFDYVVKIANGPSHQIGRASVVAREAKALNCCQRFAVPNVIDLVEYRKYVLLKRDGEFEIRALKKNSISTNKIQTSEVLAVRFAANGSLEDRLIKNGRISEQKCKLIAKSILETLVVLHNKAHIMHRDIKPANIMFDDRDNVKLIDFGVYARGDSKYQFAGSPYYAAPEIWKSSKDGSHYDCKVDLWSLGATLYHVIMGKPPIEGRNLFHLAMMIEKFMSNPQLDFDDKVSPNARSLIQSLLTAADKRLDANQALKHPWFTELKASWSLEPIICKKLKV